MISNINLLRSNQSQISSHKQKKVFYFGTNDTSTITDIRKTILKQFKELPEMTEYMHYSSFDGADRYGKDTFMLIKYLGKSAIPALFRLKRVVEMIVSLIPLFTLPLACKKTCLLYTSDAADE